MSKGGTQIDVNLNTMAMTRKDLDVTRRIECGLRSDEDIKMSHGMSVSQKNTYRLSIFENIPTTKHITETNCDF